MNEQQWRAARDSRSMRDAGRVLDPERLVVLRANAPYAARYDGQVAVLTAANLLARMSQEYLGLSLRDSVKEKWRSRNAWRVSGLE
jgi:hypothetical protein